MNCDTNQFPTLQFCGTHPHPHCARGLIKHDHLRFGPKLVHGICTIRHIPYACVAFTKILYKHCISGKPSKKQSYYQPVTDCTYWPVLGSFNNWNSIHMSPKSTHSESFEEIHKVVIDRISDNMASLVQSGKYGAINTADTTTNGFYAINFISEAYTL